MHSILSITIIETWYFNGCTGIAWCPSISQSPQLVRHFEMHFALCWNISICSFQCWVSHLWNPRESSGFENWCPYGSHLGHHALLGILFSLFTALRSFPDFSSFTSLLSSNGTSFCAYHFLILSNLILLSRKCLLAYMCKLFALQGQKPSSESSTTRSIRISHSFQGAYSPGKNSCNARLVQIVQIICVDKLLGFSLIWLSIYFLL